MWVETKAIVPVTEMWEESDHSMSSYVRFAYAKPATFPKSAWHKNVHAMENTHLSRLNVKFNLEEAMKAPRGSRVIVILFL